MFSVYNLRPEDVLGFYLNKKGHLNSHFLLSFVKPCMCARIHAHKIQEQNQLVKLECEQ